VYSVWKRGDGDRFLDHGGRWVGGEAGRRGDATSVVGGGRAGQSGVRRGGGGVQQGRARKKTEDIGVAGKMTDTRDCEEEDDAGEWVAR
jgi:hypothetical protein